MLNELRNNEIVLEADTIHILLRDAFSNTNTYNNNNNNISNNNPDSLFKSYFISNTNTNTNTNDDNSKKIFPTTRTLNTMIEGYRLINDNDKAYYYYKLLTGPGYDYYHSYYYYYYYYYYYQI